MKKVKIKLKAHDLNIIATVAMEKCNSIISEDIATVAYQVMFREISQAISYKLVNNTMNGLSSSKEVSVKILESQALAFYAEFIGEGLTNHISGVIQQVNKQIEYQLFIAGEYKI